MDHAEEAKRLFLEGYNCAQAVFCAFCDLTGVDVDAAARMASSFGGGMGRLREVCGAVSGALLALGMLRGYDDPHDPGSQGGALSAGAGICPPVLGEERDDRLQGTAARRADDARRHARAADAGILRAPPLPAHHWRSGSDPGRNAE